MSRVRENGKEFQMKKFLYILATMTLFKSYAFAGVVFGNLGPAAADNLSSFNADIRITNIIAQGFTIGGSSMYLQSVTLGLFGATAPTTVSAVVGIYSSSSGQPDAPVYWSTNNTIGEEGKYTFLFDSATLSANQTYWVIPQYNISWYLNESNSAPIEQNLSGVTYAGTSRSTNNAATWATAAVDSYSISVSATQGIPEPSTWLAGIMLIAILILVKVRQKQMNKSI